MKQTFYAELEHVALKKSNPEQYHILYTGVSRLTDYKANFKVFYGVLESIMNRVIDSFVDGLRHEYTIVYTLNMTISKLRDMMIDALIEYRKDNNSQLSKEVKGVYLVMEQLSHDFIKYAVPYLLAFIYRNLYSNGIAFFAKKVSSVELKAPLTKYSREIISLIQSELESNPIPLTIKTG